MKQLPLSNVTLHDEVVRKLPLEFDYTNGKTI